MMTMINYTRHIISLYSWSRIREHRNDYNNNIERARVGHARFEIAVPLPENTSSNFTFHWYNHLHLCRASTKSASRCASSGFQTHSYLCLLETSDAQMRIPSIRVDLYKGSIGGISRMWTTIFFNSNMSHMCKLRRDFKLSLWSVIFQ